MSNANEQAFASATSTIDGHTFHSKGLTKRELIAAMCLQGILSTITIERDRHSRLMAETAVIHADALLKELERRRGVMNIKIPQDFKPFISMKTDTVGQLKMMIESEKDLYDTVISSSGMAYGFSQMANKAVWFDQFMKLNPEIKERFLASIPKANPE